jgi:hypothetical protein
MFMIICWQATAVPKKVKIQTRAPTQAELIARALDTEEGNIVEHRDYLRLEEEKRKRAQAVRTSIYGPVLRWISKGEEAKVVVEAPQFARPYGSLYPPVPAYSNSNVPNSIKSSSSAPTSYPFSGSGTANLQLHMTPVLTTATSSQLSGQMSYASASQQLQSIELKGKVTKNYVLHELAQYDGVPKPPWADTMESMFGDHVNWEELRVYVGKGRPFSERLCIVRERGLCNWLWPSARPKQTCLITGLPARYLDPRTGVPYANIQAFQTLTRILAHEYIWSDSLGCYVGDEGSPHAQGIAGNIRRTSDDAMDVH